jgi:hypothetical protein
MPNFSSIPLYLVTTGLQAIQLLLYMCQPHGQATYTPNLSFVADQRLDSLMIDRFVLNICGSLTSTLHG